MPNPTLHPPVANIRAEMARRGLTGKDMADAIGCSPMSFSRRMSGATPLRVDELQAIADALGLPVTALLVDAA